MLEYTVLSEKELNIIEKGKKGNLTNIEEVRFYYQYLVKFKKEYLEELRKQYDEENYELKLLGIVLCTLGGAFSMLVLSGGNILLILLFAVIFSVPLVAIGMYSPLKAKRYYQQEKLELESVLAVDDVKHEKKQKKKEQEILKHEGKNSKKDSFIANISEDISLITVSKYPGYEEHVLALYSLADKYLKLKGKLQISSSSELLLQYPNFNAILLGIENRMHKCIKLQKSQNINYAQLIEALHSSSSKMMSEEELLKYAEIAEKDITLTMHYKH